MYILHYAPDNASLVLRLALETLGVPYETLLVNRAENAQRSAEYLQINPAGKIPTLQTPHGPIFETAAALLWLADTHGELAPKPADPARGDFLKWLFFCSNTIHPSLRTLFYTSTIAGPAPATQGMVCKHAKSALQNDLKVLDQGRGDLQTLQMTDFYIVCMLRWCAIYGPEDRAWFSLSDYPQLAKIAKRVESLPCTQAAIRSEGLGQNPFTHPIRPTPPEGHAT